MAGAEIIASGIGILCLIIFGYVLVGGILSTGENVVSAQNDYVLMKESQRETAINIPSLSPEQPEFICVDDSWNTYTWRSCNLTFYINNTGTEMIGSFSQTDVYVNVSEKIIKGSAPLPLDVITQAGEVTHLKFDPTNITVGGKEPDGTWSYIQISPDIIHPNMLDPNEKMKVQINNYSFSTIPPHYTITVVTPNGVTDTYSQ